MCAGAIVLARIQRLVYGASDPRAGACGTLYNIVQDSRLNHRCDIRKGVLAEESSELLWEYFKKRRNNSNKVNS
ncbi:tRNA-specific adenosine deaminase [bioreactor metagenome]|uniref:tRNA-specific adenosine deaminase n=2 Tax=root TaxID=1 RepID=A0A645IF27_9ZZZZ